MEKSNNLSELFDNGFKLYNELNNSNEATNSSKIQSTVRSLMNVFEEATKLVSLADMFSSNENFEEVSTENLKYFLLPALLGTLAIKICAAEDRSHIVDVAEIYFVDFLKRLKSYDLIDFEIPEITPETEQKSDNPTTEKSNAELITEMVNARNTKLKRYQEKKELEKKLSVLEKNLDNPNIDDEIKREYFITLIKTFANQAIDELSSLAAEKSILDHMKKIGSSEKETKKPTGVKLKPIIITRDAIQKKVYGAGYPSLPVLTVQEFYDQKVKEGEWPDRPHGTKIGNNSLQDIAGGKIDEALAKDQEDEENERKIEKDDEENLVRMRAMDEYKDDHRRGWGNRANRS